MNRIVFFLGLLLATANFAAAQTPRVGAAYSHPTYSRPVTVAQPVSAARVVAAKPVLTTAAPMTAANSHSTATAQGVANIMASRGTVGHFGGNSGYEGCGMASTPQAAYSICCYANSGLTTVDVGYARGANGMWYCCRRYR